MLRLAKDMLLAENSSYFTSVLPPSEHWRLYKDFRDDAVFIDLEFSSIKGYPTIISLYDGYDVKTFVRGMNMDKELIKHELDKAKLIVSFNGSVFDMHFLKRYFNIDTDIPHFDLRFALARLGYSGGLKDIEKEFGIRRLNHFVDDLKSGDPFLLWRTFLATADDHYLDLLVEYNQEDVINLKVISDKVIERLEWTCKN